MKRTWFCNFAAKYNWLLCSRTNTFLLNFPLFWTGLSLTTTFASMMAIATWSTSPVGTSCLRWCSANLVIVRVFVIWLWLLKHIGPSNTILDKVVNLSPKRLLRQQIRIVTTGSSRTSLSIWWRKPARSERPTSWISQERNMPLIQLLSRCVWQHSHGRSFEERREASKPMSYMTLRLRFRPSILWPQHPSMIRRQCLQFPVSQMLTTYSTGLMTHLRNSTGYTLQSLSS